MEISRLWIAMLTRNRDYSGTNDLITLIINQGGVDRLEHTFTDTSQLDLERGEANLYEVNVEGLGIVPEELNNSSIRVVIHGKDAWRPQHFVVWGERVSFDGTEVIPLAVETDVTVQLSTEKEDSGKAVPSSSLNLVGRGNRNMQINRLFMFMTTSPDDNDTDPETDSPLEIQMVSEGKLVVLTEIKDTTQKDLEAGGANFYSAPVIVPFTKRSLDHDSITLRIKGLDDWRPSSFFIFGLDHAAGRPDNLIPLVHLPEWPHGFMQADPTSGMASVTLALAHDPRRVADIVDELTVKLDSVTDGQERMFALLQTLVARQDCRGEESSRSTASR